jgi:hypothetical protein
MRIFDTAGTSAILPTKERKIVENRQRMTFVLDTLDAMNAGDTVL